MRTLTRPLVAPTDTQAGTTTRTVVLVLQALQALQATTLPMVLQDMAPQATAPRATAPQDKQLPVLTDQISPTRRIPESIQTEMVDSLATPLVITTAAVEKVLLARTTPG